MLSPRRARRRLAVAAYVACAAFAVLGRASASIPQCATPSPSADPYSKGTENTLSWTQPTGTLQGSGFVIEVATSPAAEPDGSFVSANVFTVKSVGPTVRRHTFTGLPERELFYHLRASGSSAKCSDSAWSVVVSTTQDATPPSAAIATPNARQFALEPVRIDGTAVDDPGPAAATSSGVKHVKVSLANTTPVAGPIFLQPPAQKVPVDQEGAWAATFTDVRPGTYVVNATAVDNEGNETPTPATISILVVSPPA